MRKSKGLNYLNASKKAGIFVIYKVDPEFKLYA